MSYKDTNNLQIAANNFSNYSTSQESEFSYGASSNESTVSGGLVGSAIAIGTVILIVGGYFLVRKYITRTLQRFLSKNWVMLKIRVPKERKPEQDEQRMDFREMLAVIEPFYASIAGLYKRNLFGLWGNRPVSLEIVAKNGLISFFIGCPQELLSQVEKTIHAEYPHALIEISDINDYSIFQGKKGKVEAATIRLSKNYIFPIRTYKLLEHDGLNSITNAFSKMSKEDSAGMQILIRPTNGMWRTNIERVAHSIQTGRSRVSYASSWQVRSAETFFNFLQDLSAGLKPKSQNEDHPDPYFDPKNPHRLTPMKEQQLKLLNEKASKQALDCEIRVLTVAPTTIEARTDLEQIITAFNQFNAPDANNFRVIFPSNKKEVIANYLFRMFGRQHRCLLNTEELASIYHLPNRYIDTPNINWLLSRKEPPPATLPTEGTIVGQSLYRNENKEIRVTDNDRLRHIYMIGKTGVGKTVLFENMIMQDIRDGKGVAYLDPNGDAIDYILEHMPKERAEDVILFDPSDVERPMGLNLLEWKTPEERDFLVQEAIQMFYKLFDPGKTGIVGPQFEHWFRNAALTVMSSPDGGTLIDIPRLFTDKDFQNEEVSHLKDPVVEAFWKKQMAQTSDFHKSEMLNYFTSKFGRFMTNDLMRNIIGQPKSAFDFRDVMDNKKILLCKLSKGLIGEINAFLLGMIIVSKLAMGAFGRQNIPEEQRVPFYLYVDEFQNFITDVFATILSESRKYKLSLNITNQYIAQLDEKIRNAVIGNAGTLVAFRIGAADAEFLVKEFEPLTIDDMVNVDKFNFYIKLLVNNAPTLPFNGQSIAPEKSGNPKVAMAIKQLSRLKYGKSREVVDIEIRQRTKIDQIKLSGLTESPESMK